MQSVSERCAPCVLNAKSRCVLDQVESHKRKLENKQRSRANIKAKKLQVFKESDTVMRLTKDEQKEMFAAHRRSAEKKRAAAALPPPPLGNKPQRRIAPTVLSGPPPVSSSSSAFGGVPSAPPPLPIRKTTAISSSRPQLPIRRIVHYPTIYKQYGPKKRIVDETDEEFEKYKKSGEWGKQLSKIGESKVGPFQ
jgi:hypothetical protein